LDGLERVAGAVSTLRGAGLGIVAALAIGIAIGIGMLSSNRTISALGRLYVHVVRSVPLLLQILCWYALLRRLPSFEATSHFAALFAALSTYASAFIADNVWGGIVGVARDQTEAAAALGLSRLEALRFVVLPQALPAIVPPTASQVVNLVENSSLAVAIGYSGLVSVTDTRFDRVGRSVEALAIAMAVYLAVCLATALVMHLTMDRRYAQ
jgi:general L-amino acid transport system permease protein